MDDRKRDKRPVPERAPHDLREPLLAEPPLRPREHDDGGDARVEARNFVGDQNVGYKLALCERDMAIYAAIFLFGLLWRTDGSPDRSYAAAAGVILLETALVSAPGWLSFPKMAAWASLPMNSAMTWVCPMNTIRLTAAAVIRWPSGA